MDLFVFFSLGRNSQDVSMTSVGDEEALVASPADPTRTATTTALSAPSSPTQFVDSEKPSSPLHPPPPSFTPIKDGSNPSTHAQSKVACTSGTSMSYSSYSSSASPAPEAKKFKDSSVQVEFEPRLMPVTVTTNAPQTQLTTTPLSSSSLPPLASPSSSSNPTHLSSPQAQCSTSATVSLTPVDPSPLTLGGSSTLPVPPHPRSCSSDELLVLQACLRRWREEVETDVRGKLSLNTL